MKPALYTCLLLLLPAICSYASAAEGDEPGLPTLVPPADPLEAYYDALAGLERTVDSYFHAALRQRVAVTDEKLKELDAALGAQARQAAGEELPGILTVRELVVRAKLTMLRELDDRFADEIMPGDLEQQFTTYYGKRSLALDLLIEGGEL